MADCEVYLPVTIRDAMLIRRVVLSAIRWSSLSILSCMKAFIKVVSLPTKVSSPLTVRSTPRLPWKYPKSTALMTPLKPLAESTLGIYKKKNQYESLLKTMTVTVFKVIGTINTTGDIIPD